jgi:hypothetical protein
VWWVILTVIGLVVVVLLGVSWWLDRDARRRGARPLSGADMGRERWTRHQRIEQELTQLNTQGMLPRTGDAARDIWRGEQI